MIFQSADLGDSVEIKTEAWIGRDQDFHLPRQLAGQHGALDVAA